MAHHNIFRIVESNRSNEPEVDPRFLYRSAWQEWKRAENDEAAKREAWARLSHFALILADIPPLLHEKADAAIIDPGTETVSIIYGDPDPNSPGYGNCILERDGTVLHWFKPEGLRLVESPDSEPETKPLAQTEKTPSLRVISFGTRGE